MDEEAVHAMGGRTGLLDDFMLDSGASRHMAKEKSQFTSWEHKTKSNVYGVGSTIKSSGVGECRGLADTMCVKKMSVGGLASVSQITDTCKNKEGEHLQVRFSHTGCEIGRFEATDVAARGERRGDVYYMRPEAVGELVTNERERPTRT